MTTSKLKEADIWDPNDQGDHYPTNWGRWGLEDERGALNFITDEARARGAEEAQIGRVVSLAMPISPVLLAGGGPSTQSEHLMPAGVMQIMQVSPIAKTDVLMINSHHVTVTHIDALVHIPINDQVYPGIPINDAVPIMEGTVRRSSTSAYTDGIMTRGVLLDLAPGGRLEAGYEVGPDDLEKAEERQGVRVQSGDALVVHGGWDVKDKEPGPDLPVMTLDAVRWMAEREISIYTGDVGDRPPGIPSPLAMHFVALARLGIPLINVSDISTLAPTCSELKRWTFQFVVGPMAIRNATAVPVNPLAIF